MFETKVQIINNTTIKIETGILYFSVYDWFLFIKLEGVVEIWLTSEDTGAYGKDIGVTLPELLWQLVEVIPPGALMRIGMTNPPYIKEYLNVSGVLSFLCYCNCFLSYLCAASLTSCSLVHI